MKEQIHVIDCGGYYTVCNKLYEAKPKNHSHFWVEKAAYTLKSLIQDKIIPYSSYMIESALRVSIDSQYKARIIDEYNLPENINVYDVKAKEIIKESLDVYNKRLHRRKK